jgi:hypothetical protein
LHSYAPAYEHWDFAHRTADRLPWLQHRLTLTLDLNGHVVD